MPPAAIVLRYPSAWLTPIHRDHEIVGRDTRRWLHGLGLLHGARAQRAFEAMDVGRYGGMPFSFASHEALVTATRFLTLWILHDDELEGAPVADLRVIADAVAAEPTATPSRAPHVRGWQELGLRFRATMSDRWMARHAQRFERWLESVSAEAEQARRARTTGELPSLARYLEVRTVNIGVGPTVCWIEHALGRELDPAVLDDPELARAEALAARIITFQNDLAGLGKDVLDQWPNAVRCLAAERAISVAAAIQPVVDLHVLDVLELGRACERLVMRHGPAVRWWTDALTWMVGGFAGWHASAERYGSIAFEGRRVVVGTVVTWKVA
jgi:hypothetical protein